MASSTASSRRVALFNRIAGPFVPTADLGDLPVGQCLAGIQAQVDLTHQGVERVPVGGALLLDPAAGTEQDVDGRTEPVAPGFDQGLGALSQNTHRSRRCVDFIGLPDSCPGLLAWGFDFNDPGAGLYQGSANRGTIGAGSLHRSQYPAIGVAVDPSNGPAHPGLRDGEGFTAYASSGPGADDRISVGARVGIDSDDVVVGFCNDGHCGDPPIPVDDRYGGIGLE